MTERFRVRLPLLERGFDSRRDEIVGPAPVPVSNICNHCWYQSKCIIRSLHRDPPVTCCVFQLWNINQGEISLSDVVEFCCETACRQRQLWAHDPVPHNPDYCSRHCPVSGYILNRPKSNYNVNGQR